MSGAPPLVTIAVTSTRRSRAHSLIEALIETAHELERDAARPWGAEHSLSVTVSREPRTDVVTIRLPNRTLELTRGYADVTIPEFLADVVLAVFDPHEERARVLSCLARASAFSEPSVVLYLDDAADQPEALLDRRELELRELLELVGLDGGARVIRGASERARGGATRWRNAVRELLGVLTHEVSTPTRALLEPARGRVQYSWPAGSDDPRPLTEHTMLYAPRWITLVTGLERGTVRVGDTLELITPYTKTRATLERIRHARISGRERAHAGQTAELTVRTEDEVLRVLIGALLRAPDDDAPTTDAGQRFAVELDEYSRELAGPHVDATPWPELDAREPLRVGLGPAIWVDAEVVGDPAAKLDARTSEAGWTRALLSFQRPVVLPEGARFFFTGARGRLGRGRCLERLDDEPSWTLDDQLDAMRRASPLVLD